jgi:hypothetical protein
MVIFKKHNFTRYFFPTWLNCITWKPGKPKIYRWLCFVWQVGEEKEEEKTWLN